MKNQAGQGVVEYVLLLVLIAGSFGLLLKGMPQIFAAIEKPFKDEFVRTYKYGDPKGCGFNDTVADCSGPARHPRVPGGDGFRLFGRGPSP